MYIIVTKIFLASRVINIHVTLICLPPTFDCSVQKAIEKGTCHEQTWWICNVCCKYSENISVASVMQKGVIYQT